MSQNSLWQTNQQNNAFAEICNALYERELNLLANIETATVQSVQGRLKSLPYYINRTANMMTQVSEQGSSPLTLDVQNASWSTKQASKLPVSGENVQAISEWYLDLIAKNNKLLLGLVVPVLRGEHIALDCIDKIDSDKKRIRTNASGWFSLLGFSEPALNNAIKSAIKRPINNPANNYQLLKPNKKVMLSACAGHCWQRGDKARPIIPSLRELLLSCAINWQNFHKTLK